MQIHELNPFSGALNDSTYFAIDNGIDTTKLAVADFAKKTGHVTPEMFGAVGDGVTDDTTAWQSALDVGGIILCKAGSNYSITSVLRIKANTTILLNGATITTSAVHLFFNFLDTDAFTGYNGNGNISIIGGSIVGGSISFIHGKNIYIDRVQFSNGSNDHYFEICACKNFNITNCSFVGMSTTAPSRKEYINIDNCTYSNFPHLPADSATYDLTIVDGVLIENCYFDISDGVMQDAIGKHSYADSGNVSAYKAKNITISNCRIVGATQIAVLLLGIENVLMESCRLENCTAITNCRNSVNVTIRDNIATGITTYCEIETLTKFAFVNNFVETSSTSSVVNIAGSNDTLEFRDNSIKSSSNPALIRFDSANAITVTHFTVFNNALDVVGKRRVIYSISGTVSCQVSTSDYIEYWLGNDSVATNAHFNLTDFNALLIQLGAIGSTTSITVTIRSFTERNFLVGESFPYVYVSTGGVISYGTITITDAHTITATGLKIRDVIAQALPRR